jgi:hypothetical protein
MGDLHTAYLFDIEGTNSETVSTKDVQDVERPTVAIRSNRKVKSREKLCRREKST